MLWKIVFFCIYYPGLCFFYCEAYISILEDYSSMGMWLGDGETSGTIGHILRTYHEEKHILAINQFVN